MNKTNITNRARPAIQALKAYSSARSLYVGRDDVVFLDANEMPCEPFIGARDYNRYAGQQPLKLVEALTKLYDVSSRNLLIGRGADEAIDLLVRSFCEPGQDNIIICPPTFPMYAQAALVQGCACRDVPLRDDFSLDLAQIKAVADEATKIIFVCSPNNPTGNLMARDDIEDLCVAFEGKALVVVDEAYVEFAGEEPSFLPWIERFDNLVVLRTLSKAYGTAGVRCGVAIGHSSVMDLLKTVLPPYPVPQPVVEAVTATLTDKNKLRLVGKRAEILKTRDCFVGELENIPVVQKIHPSDTNFVLVQFDDAQAVVKQACENGIILRDQSYQLGLAGCIRISIGTHEEMEKLLSVLKGESIPQKPQRTAIITRKTKETAISVQVNLDAAAPVKISTGVGFYDHMLEQIARHGGFALEVECAGDLEIDPHHTIEDVAIALGQALKEALGDKAGIGRYGFTLPMDEAQASVALDLSGRFYLQFEGAFPENMAGDMPSDMVEHVFRSLAENMQANLHMKVEGENTHHMIEGCFKAFGRALRRAIRKEGEELPSTKGIL